MDMIIAETLPRPNKLGQCTSKCEKKEGKREMALIE
jgi:hypothetical protein